MPPVHFQAARKPNQTSAGVVSVRQGPVTLQFQPQLDDIGVGYTTESKARVLQQLQSLQPQGLQDDTSYKLFRFKLPASVKPDVAWQQLNAMVTSGSVPFASPMLKALFRPGESRILKNLIQVVFKKTPSSRQLESLTEKHRLKLVKVNDFEPEYRFEITPRPWQETLKLLDALHDQPNVKSAEGNYLRFIPKPD